jgi:acetylornithine deacetylase/succinyl-diaminopimelate desuccinylase-like protein
VRQVRERGVADRGRAVLAASASSRGIRLVREAAQGLDVRHGDVLSQGGHDTYYISRIAPAAMIFTPCRDGTSHHEAEHADRDTTVPGVNVLLQAVLAWPDLAAGCRGDRARVTGPTRCGRIRRELRRASRATPSSGGG